MENKIKEIISTVLKIDASHIGPETNAEFASSWDSLNHIKILLVLEEEFELNFEEEHILRMDSFDRIVTVINELKS